MKMKRKLTSGSVAVAGWFLLCGAGAWGRDWIVDTAHLAAADTGAGTREAPFKTIGAAALKTEPGDRVLVRPGVYREEVVIGVSGRPDAPIVFESEVPHAAVVTGSDPAPAGNWTEVEPGIWRAVWPKPLRFNRNGNGEWVYAGGAPLLRVETAGELLPGRFRLDFEARAVDVMLEEGRTPADTTLELAWRDGLFRSANWENSQRLKTGAPWITDIVIRGFTVIHNADWFRGFGAIRVTGERWLVENNRVRFGSRMGIQTGSTRDCVVRSNTVEWVGVTGVGGSPNLGLRFEDNTVRFGNFRRNDPGAEGGGSKFLGTIDGVFTGNRFEENYGSGLWFDGGNSFNVIRDNRATDNFVFGGFFSEIGWHDFYAGNVSAYNEIGFLIGETPGSVLYRNIACGNSKMGIRMRGNYRREAGMTPEELEARLRDLAARIPNFPPERLERRRFHMLQYLVATPYRLLNNCAIVENLVFDNAIGHIEYRLYGAATNPLAPFVQNFSDYNVFWARDTNQVLFAGPVGYVYPDGLAGWQAASERDLHSIVADPRATGTPLPAWAKDHPLLKEPRLRLNTDMTAAGLTIVPSPETALLYARLRRAGEMEPVSLPVPALRACRFTFEGETWLAVWNTEERGRRYVTLRVAQPGLVVEDAYGVRRRSGTEGGLLDLGVDYRPLFLRGLTGAVAAVEWARLDVRRFNAVGAAVPVSLELFNDGPEAAFRGELRAAGGFRVEPAAWATNLAAGARATLRAQLVPEGSVSGTVARVGIDGRLGALPVRRLAQFAIGEGAGTIPHAAGPMRVDGRTDDWGDLAKRTPLFELGDVARDGFGDAHHWSGPDDLSVTFHTAWTEQGLYWLARVRDDRPVGCPEGVQPFMSDAIELFFDGRSPEMQWDPKAGEGTVQLSLSPAVGGRPSAAYRRPETLAYEAATGEWAGGYLIEGFLPFDPAVFPAGEWREGRAVKLAVHVLDRDNPEGLGINYNRGFCALGWGATRIMEKHRTTGEERPIIRTNSSTAGWKTLTLER
jgi:hypothetical protein